MTVIAIIFYFAQFVLHFDDPLATLTISNDSTVVFSQDAVLELTSAALRQVGLEPIEPKPYGNGFIGRNSLRPDDEVSVIWSVLGGSYPSYTVRLSREKHGIKATVGENWL